MITTGDISAVRAFRSAGQKGHSWGLVPTMGYLHQGHLSLVRRAREENDRVIVTLFVNPTQFSPAEDLSHYPRDIARDKVKLKEEGVDLLFAPDPQSMYPPDFQTTVNVQHVSKPLEGTSRPTHFQGVATVVAKLFNITQPHRAYFGQKDAQQAVVLRQMIRDLNFNLEFIICPTVREPDGLAMSSRNSYLSPAERQAATVLFRALRQAQSALERGEQDGKNLRQLMTRLIAAEPLARLDYVSVADPLTLVELDEARENALLSIAVYIGKTRLIDNILVGSDLNP